MARIRHLCKPLQPLAPGRSLAGILEAVSAAYEGDVQMIDRSSIRVHQHGDRKGSRLHGSFGSSLTIDIHALVDAIGLPIVLKLTASQAHDGRCAADMIDARHDGDVLLADRAYDRDALRIEMDARRAGPKSSRWQTLKTALY